MFNELQTYYSKYISLSGLSCTGCNYTYSVFLYTIHRIAACWYAVHWVGCVRKNKFLQII